MPVLRRAAATVFVAALVSAAGASAALADDPDVINLSTPSITSQSLGGSEETSVFARSIGGDLLLNRRLADGWTGFRNIGGNSSLVHDSSAVILAGTVYVFVRASGDSQVYVDRVSNGISSGIVALPGLKTLGRPTAIVSNGLIGVFARGLDNRGFVNVLRDGRWQGWRSLGSETLLSDLSPVNYPVGAVPLVVARGADNAAWIRRVNLGSGVGSDTRWTSLGGAFTSNITPAVVQRRPFAGGRVEIALYLFARGFGASNPMFVSRAEDTLSAIPRLTGFGQIPAPFALYSDIAAPAFTEGSKLTVAVRNERRGLSAITFDYDDITNRQFRDIGFDGQIEGNPVAIHPTGTQPGSIRSDVTEVYARAGDQTLRLRTLGPDGQPTGALMNLGGQLGGRLGGG